MISVVVALLLVAAVDEGSAPPRERNGIGGLDGRRVIVVPADEQGGAQAEAVTAALQARGLVPVAPEARAGVDGVVVDVVGGDRERARTLLQEARARYRDLDLDAAARAAADALAELLRLERPEDQRDLLVDTLLFTAAVLLSAGDEGGLPLVRLAARLEPAREELHPGLHPPRVVAAWQQARQQNAAAASTFVIVAPRVVGVSSAPEVVVDGDVRVPEGGLLLLAEGPHLVTLRARGAAGRSRVVDVVGRDTPPLDDVLAPAGIVARRKEAALRVRDGDASAFATLQALVDADVVVALSSGGRPRARADGAVVDVPGDPRDVAGFASAVLQALAPRPKPPAPEEPEPEQPAWVTAALVALPIAVVVVSGGVAWNVIPGGEVERPARPVRWRCCQN